MWSHIVATMRGALAGSQWVRAGRCHPYQGSEVGLGWVTALRVQRAGWRSWGGCRPRGGGRVWTRCCLLPSLRRPQSLRGSDRRAHRPGCIDLLLIGFNPPISARGRRSVLAPKQSLSRKVLAPSRSCRGPCPAHPGPTGVQELRTKSTAVSCLPETPAIRMEAGRKGSASRAPQQREGSPQPCCCLLDSPAPCWAWRQPSRADPCA